ncbi:MAG: hypothetical protein ACFCUJ_03635 [Thiotrichales bacterium]
MRDESRASAETARQLALLVTAKAVIIAVVVAIILLVRAVA